MPARLLLGAALIAAATAAIAVDFQSMSRDQIRSEIKARCQDAMAQYGDAMTLACMKQDWQGAQHVQTALKTHPDIAHRCLGQMRSYGYAMVDACIKQDAGAKGQIDDW